MITYFVWQSNVIAVILVCASLQAYSLDAELAALIILLDFGSRSLNTKKSNFQTKLRKFSLEQELCMWHFFLEGIPRHEDSTL